MAKRNGAFTTNCGVWIVDEFLNRERQKIRSSWLGLIFREACGFRSEQEVQLSLSFSVNTQCRDAEIWIRAFESIGGIVQMSLALLLQFESLLVPFRVLLELDLTHRDLIQQPQGSRLESWVRIALEDLG